mgnify:CR=1 FL=1
MQLTLGTYIPIDSIKITGLNPRKNFDDESMKELAKSIQNHGILEPIIVRPKGNHYELVAGERRLRAAKMVGLDKVPVIIREYTDEQMMEIMLMENLQRKDLTPIEEAHALQKIIASGIKKEDLAKRIGKSESWVSKRLRLLELPEELQKLVDEGRLTIEQALKIVPFAKWPVIKFILKEIKNTLEGDLAKGYLASDDIDWILSRAVENRTYALNLDFFGYTLKDVQEYFDFSECKNCKAPIKYNDSRICLHKECFSMKLKEAKRKLREAKEKELEEMKQKSIVDLDKIGYGNYVELADTWDAPKFDTSVCENCPHKKMGIRWNGEKVPVCLNPSCFREKQEKAEEEIKRRIRETIETVKKNLETVRITKLHTNGLRIVLLKLVDEVGIDPLEVLQPWNPPEKWEKLIDQLNDEQLVQAIIRAVVLDDLTQLEWGENLDELLIKKYLPELMEKHETVHNGGG